MTVSMTKMIRIGTGMGTTKICENPVIITSIFVVVIFTLMLVVVVFATSFSFPTIFLIITIIFNITFGGFPRIFSYFFPHWKKVLPLVNAPKNINIHGKSAVADLPLGLSNQVQTHLRRWRSLQPRDVARDAGENTHPYKSSVTYT